MMIVKCGGAKPIWLALKGGNELLVVKPWTTLVCPESKRISNMFTRHLLTMSCPAIEVVVG